MKFFKFFISALIITISLTSTAKATPEGFADIVKPLFPAVVNISATQKESKERTPRDNYSPFPEGSPFEEFNQFFEKFAHPKSDQKRSNRASASLGSGFIIDQNGYIVTNNHIISDADEIIVTLSSGTQLKATVVGADKKTDLALLKIKHKKLLPFVKFGDSDQSRVGDWVIAIGNPFGLGGTVTAGIISAHERDIQPDGLVDNFIQTDAAINRGNSGGPMFNMKGEVIGINTAILSPSGVYIGIGFATPSSVAKIVIDQLKTKGKIDRGVLGVLIQQLSEDIAEPLGLKENQGALVVEVVKNGAASQAGIKVGDVITSFDNHPINNLRKLSRTVAESPLNKKLKIDYIRDGKSKTTDVILLKSKDDVKASIKAPIKGKKVLGAQIAPLNSALKEQFNIDKNVKGLVILNIPKKSMWKKKGFTKGDVLMRSNQRILENVNDLEKTINMARKKGKKSILLLVYRNGHAIFVPVEISK